MCRSAGLALWAQTVFCVPGAWSLLVIPFDCPHCDPGKMRGLVTLSNSKYLLSPLSLYCSLADSHPDSWLSSLFLANVKPYTSGLGFPPSKVVWEPRPICGASQPPQAPPPPYLGTVPPGPSLLFSLDLLLFCWPGSWPQAWLASPNKLCQLLRDDATKAHAGCLVISQISLC